MPDAAKITVRVPAVLRDYCGCPSEMTLAPGSVRAVLAEIERVHDPLFRSVCDETGAVRRHLNLFVNVTHVREMAGLDTELKPGDVLTILPAVSGG
jgi:molybdopterin synthase sulfur carrier subunit